ncbi:MAG: hypothetical protein WC405_06020 [Syntrophales bacterium]
MKTISNKGSGFNPQMDDIVGKTMGAWCLCPTWMAWMPWLVDGVEVPRVQGKKRERNSINHRHHAGLDG